MNEAYLIALILGTAAVALLIWALTLKGKNDQAQSRLDDRQKELDQIKAELAETKLQEAETAEENIGFRTSRAQLDEKLLAAQEKLNLLVDGKAEELKRQEERFELLANRILEEKGKKLSVTHQEELKGMIGPLKEQINQFKAKVEEVYVTEGKERASLLAQVVNLQNLNQQLSQDTHNLTKALKNDSKTQGRLGEVILGRVLEESGLRLGHEYELEKNYSTVDGNLRPDAVVHLNQERDLVIDAKCSLTAYEAYYNAEAEDEKQSHLKEHAASVKRHIKLLSEKNYEQIEEIKTLDFVLMFVPIEPALFAALEQDQTLFKTGFDARVLLVSPSTLFIVLKMVESLWRQEYQSQNTQKITKQAESMLSKFVLFTEAMEDVGIHLTRAQKAHGEAVGRLSEGKDNLVGQAKKLQQLGVNSKKALPESGDDEA